LQQSDFESRETLGVAGGCAESRGQSRVKPSELLIDDTSGKLKKAINAGTLWLGFEITEGFSANMTVKLSELVADVTIL
jgi:hypothetical protein